MVLFRECKCGICNLNLVLFVVPIKCKCIHTSGTFFRPMKGSKIKNIYNVLKDFYMV